MNGSEPRPVGEFRRLVHELRELGNVRAPASLAPAVLSRVGLGDDYAQLDTPIGPVFVAYNDNGISMVARAAGAGDFEGAFRARFRRPLRRVAEPPAALVQALNHRLHGNATPSMRFDLRGLSEFERAVLLKALEIPRAEVRPYAWVAREIGRPGAVRAVGTALRHNPIPLFIPCHRVVRSDGRIGEYSLGGPQAKRAVLAAEGVEPDGLEALARTGVRYLGSDTTRIYCFPTCRQARRIGVRHRVTFGSEAAATAAGYRPCKLCRPAAGL